MLMVMVSVLYLPGLEESKIFNEFATRRSRGPRNLSKNDFARQAFLILFQDGSRFHHWDEFLWSATFDQENFPDLLDAQNGLEARRVDWGSL